MNSHILMIINQNALKLMYKYWEYIEYQLEKNISLIFLSGGLVGRK